MDCNNTKVFLMERTRMCKAADALFSLGLNHLDKDIVKNLRECGLMDKE